MVNNQLHALVQKFLQVFHLLLKSLLDRFLLSNLFLKSLLRRWVPLQHRLFLESGVCCDVGRYCSAVDRNDSMYYTRCRKSKHFLLLNERSFLKFDIWSRLVRAFGWFQIRNLLDLTIAYHLHDRMSSLAPWNRGETSLSDKPSSLKT